MFSFEGDFKTRPKVSLGGASRKVSPAPGLGGGGPAGAAGPALGPRPGPEQVRGAGVAAPRTLRGGGRRVALSLHVAKDTVSLLGNGQRYFVTPESA